MITFDEYLADPPLVHTWDDGRTWNSGGFSADYLRLIHDLASAVPQARIVETGAGNSSIAFLYSQPARLVSIAPDAGLFQRIEGYCTKAGIDASRWDRIVEQSETALPRLMLSELHQFDIALIDGCHGMPTVFVDFVYMHARLKVGGLIIIDDVQIHSAKELALLLANEPGFTLVRQMHKLVVFRKEWDREFIGDFGNQRHVLERNAYYASQLDPYALTVRTDALTVRTDALTVRTDALTVRTERFRTNSLFKSMVRPLRRAGFNSFVRLTELPITLLPSASDKIYQIMRDIYWLLPIKAERKRHWANRVVGGSVLLSGLAINGAVNKHADELASLPLTFSTGARGSRGFGRRALVIEHRLPTPDRTSGSVRLAALVKLIRKEGWGVTFVSDSKKEDYHWVLKNVKDDLPRYENMLSDIGVSYVYGFEQATELLTREGATFDLVILSYPEIMHKYAPLVRAFAPLAHLVYDTVDLHGLRFSREAAIRDEKAELVKKAEYYDRIERAGFQVADTVIAITPNEAEQIASHCTKAIEPIIIPNIHCVDANIEPIEKRTGLLFIGHYLHTPNEDAVCYFMQEIYPLIERKLPGIEFTMLGSSITDKVRSLGTEAIHAVGYVADPEPYFAKASVFVAPLRYGAGMKGKIGQALSLGLPVVSTSIGAEGMGLLNERHLLVADDPQAFAAAVVRLYTDNGLWQRISAAGQDHILRNFSELAAKPAIAALLERATHAVK
jgi:glycosyltransferase involved in cell wall biosynthesis/predicted O-methyltransferase YrrM